MPSRRAPFGFGSIPSRRSSPSSRRIRTIRSELRSPCSDDGIRVESGIDRDPAQGWQDLARGRRPPRGRSPRRLRRRPAVRRRLVRAAGARHRLRREHRLDRSSGERRELPALQLPVRVPTVLRVGARKLEVVRKVSARRSGGACVRRESSGSSRTPGADRPAASRFTGGSPTRTVSRSTARRSRSSASPAFGENEFAALGLAAHRRQRARFTYTRPRHRKAACSASTTAGARRIRAATRDVFLTGARVELASR